MLRRRAQRARRGPAGRTVGGAPPPSPFLLPTETRRICRARAPTLRLFVRTRSRSRVPRSSIADFGQPPPFSRRGPSRRARAEVRSHPRSCAVLSLSLSCAWFALFFNSSRRRLPVGKDLPWIRFCRQEPAHRVWDLITKPCSPEPQPVIELARVPSMAAGLLEVSSQKLIPSSHP